MDINNFELHPDSNREKQKIYINDFALNIFVPSPGCLVLFDDK